MLSLTSPRHISTLRKAEDAEAPKALRPTRRLRMSGRSPQEQRRVRPDSRSPRLILEMQRPVLRPNGAGRLLILAGR